MKAIIPLLIWMGIIAILSLSPVYDGSTYRYFPHEDKLAHAVIYAVMAILMGWTIYKNSSNLHILWIILVSSASYGYLMEVLQDRLDTGRMFDSADIVANIFGAFAGTMLIYILNRSKKKKFH